MDTHIIACPATKKKTYESQPPACRRLDRPLTTSVMLLRGRWTRNILISSRGIDHSIYVSVLMCQLEGKPLEKDSLFHWIWSMTS